jgi:hypothetical protein
MSVPQPLYRGTNRLQEGEIVTEKPQTFGSGLLWHVIGIAGNE